MCDLFVTLGSLNKVSIYEIYFLSLSRQPIQRLLSNGRITRYCASVNSIRIRRTRKRSIALWELRFMCIQAGCGYHSNRSLEDYKYQLRTLSARVPLDLFWSRKTELCHWEQMSTAILWLWLHIFDWLTNLVATPPPTSLFRHPPFRAVGCLVPPLSDPITRPAS